MVPLPTPWMAQEILLLSPSPRTQHGCLQRGSTESHHTCSQAEGSQLYQSAFSRGVSCFTWPHVFCSAQTITGCILSPTQSVMLCSKALSLQDEQTVTQENNLGDQPVSVSISHVPVVPSGSHMLMLFSRSPLVLSYSSLDLPPLLTLNTKLGNFGGHCSTKSGSCHTLLQPCPVTVAHPWPVTVASQRARRVCCPGVPCPASHSSLVLHIFLLLHGKKH